MSPAPHAELVHHSEMLLLVVGSIALCGIAYTYFCVKIAEKTVLSLIYRCGAAVVMGLMLSQCGALLRANSMGISEQLLSYCVCGIFIMCLLYFLLLLFLCHQVKSCAAQFMLLSVVVLFGSVAVLLEFGTPIDSNFSRYMIPLTPYRNKRQYFLDNHLATFVCLVQNINIATIQVHVHCWSFSDVLLCRDNYDSF